MRVTILTLGSRGDVQPFMALAVGLERAGHDVRLATHERFEPLVASQGIGFAPLAEGRLSRGAETAEGRRWIESGSRRLPTWLGFVRDARSVAHRRLGDAFAACEGADAIVSSNLATLLGWQMSERFGVPLVRAHFNPPTWTARRFARPVATATRQVVWFAARPWLRSVRRNILGASKLPLREPIAGLDRRRAPILCAFSPAVFREPARAGSRIEVTGYWFLDTSVDPDPPAALVNFLAAGPPPVYVGFGTQIDTDRARTTALVIEALQRAGRRGILVGESIGPRGAELSAGVFGVEAISHDWLFPRCAAVVHHAAAGTTATALRAGVPSVPVPHMTDQFAWSRRVHELGVGAPPIRRRDLSAERLAQAIRAATTQDQMRRRAAALGERIRAEDGVARAIEVFERYVDADHRPAGATVRGQASPVLD